MDLPRTLSQDNSSPALEPPLARETVAAQPRAHADAARAEPSNAAATEAPASRALAVFQLACWFGLVLAIVEVVARWALSRYLQKLPLALTHPHVGWMTLASDLTLYATLGAVLAIVCWRVPHFPIALATALFAIVFFYGLGDVLQVDQWYAALALAIGLGAAAARSTARLQALARRTVWPLAAAALMLAGGIYGWSVLRESRATAALPPAAAGAPNVILITLDTVRADHLSLYHYRRRTTPRLEEYAKRGVVFDQAISTVSWTLPSHASLFTGHYPPEIFHDTPPPFAGDWKVPMDGTLPTLAEYFDAHGYRTAGFAANAMYCDRMYGLARGFDHYEEYTVNLEQALRSSFLTRTAANWLGKNTDRCFVLARKDGQTLNGQFLHWLDGVQGKPFFAFVNYLDAHDPYEAPPPFAGLFAPEGGPVRHVRAAGGQGPDLDKLDPDNYDCCLAALDEYLGQLLDELERRGLLNNTLLVITADHGEHLGEHNYHGHGDTLYMPVLHVPLVVLFPGRVPAGKWVHGPASLGDLAATIVDVAGVADGAPFPGTSLRNRWDERHAAARPAFSYLDLWFTSITNQSATTIPVRLRSVVDDHYQYLEGVGDGFRALFDLKRDPTEQRDLSGVDGQEPVLQRYHALTERGPS